MASRFRRRTPARAAAALRRRPCWLIAAAIVLAGGGAAFGIQLMGDHSAHSRDASRQVVRIDEEIHEERGALAQLDSGVISIAEFDDRMRLLQAEVDESAATI